VIVFQGIYIICIFYLNRVIYCIPIVATDSLKFLKMELVKKYPKDFIKKSEQGDETIVNVNLIKKFKPAVPGFIYYCLVIFLRSSRCINKSFINCKRI
jgi:hypothetical protein